MKVVLTIILSSLLGINSFSQSRNELTQQPCASIFVKVLNDSHKVVYSKEPTSSPLITMCNGKAYRFYDTSEEPQTEFKTVDDIINYMNAFEWVLKKKELFPKHLGNQYALQLIFEHPTI